MAHAGKTQTRDSGGREPEGARLKSIRFLTGLGTAGTCGTYHVGIECYTQKAVKTTARDAPASEAAGAAR